VICLQGGAEFGADGAAMDADLVRAAAESGMRGPIVITALAGAPGREYDTANRNGVRHFTSCVDAVYRDGDGADPTARPDVLAAPDARSDAPAARALIASTRLLVLPGGSPSRLLTALCDSGLVDVIHDLLARGGVVMGASAGAMVLCERTWLPDAGRIEPGLGLVPGCLVLPHWSSGAMDRLNGLGGLGGLGATISVLGLPEQSGLVLNSTDEGLTATAVGHRPSFVVTPGGQPLAIPVGGSAPLPGRMEP